MGIVEAILFVTGNAVEKSEICRAMGITHEELEETLNALEGGYDYDRRGLRLLRFGQHVQLATRPDYAKYVEKLLQPVQKQSLSQAVMETLAVIAYRQPVTKAEIELIRGVKCDYSVQMLVSRGLIEEVGRKEALGRPILYGTTDAFLRHFCRRSIFPRWRIELPRQRLNRRLKNRRPIRWTSWRRTSPAKRRRNKNCAAGCRLIHRGEAVAAQAAQA